MTRYLSAIFLFLMPFLAYADVHDAPPPTEMNVVGIIVFLVLFVGGCVGFFAMVWWNDKKKPKQGETAQK